MAIELTGANGESVADAVKERLHGILSKAIGNSAKEMQDVLLNTTRNHFSTIYPGSRRWSPSKVHPKAAAGLEASIDIDVPGVTRAYHDIDIVPKYRRALTIPIHRSAYGKKAADFNDLFIFKNKVGTAFLARNRGGVLSMLFLLVKRVHQRRDRRLMPSDETYAESIFARLIARLSKN